MTTGLISIRSALAEDAPGMALIHEEAWRHSYQGLIPHLHLSRMIARRGPGWWQQSLLKGLDAVMLDFDGEAVGYATLGPGRMRRTTYEGEIYELYVRPDYQGVGFGGRLFRAARKRLAERQLRGLCVWALADNDAACAFYRHMGGRPVSEGVERYDSAALRKVAFGWR